MVQILYVRVGPPGTEERHITDVRWYNPETGVSGTTNVEGMVQFIRDTHGRAYVCNGRRVVDIEWVNDVPPYIRTKSDGIMNDNLLSLPRMD